MMAHSEEYIAAVMRHLGHVRQWIEGYNAATGGKGPSHADSLRRAQLLLREALGCLTTAVPNKEEDNEDDA